MARTILSVVTMKNLSGIPKDDFTNSFVFHSPDGLDEEAELAALSGQLVGFYNDNQPNGASISAYLANTISRAANVHEINHYDITGKLQAAPNAKGNMVPPPHGSPVKTTAWSLGAAGGATALPSEVCVVVTLRGRDALLQPVEAADGADPGGAVDRPRQRRTGRLSIGPLTTAALAAQAGDNQVRPQDAMCTTIRQACETLQDNQIGTVDPRVWCIWSRTNGALYAVTSAETDNAFDTQRRRGAQPSARVAQVFAPVPNIALGA